MNLDELKQKLAIDKLVETGVGLVSYRTYNQIRDLLIANKELDPQRHPRDVEFNGIALMPNAFIPDGEIVPFVKWDLSPKLPRKFPL